MDEDDDDSDNGDSMLPHIKSTLMQFLRNVPLGEQRNEEILAPIYSMMSFTPAEIQELKIARINARDQKQGKGSSLKKGNSTQGNSNASLSREEEGQPKKKGLLGRMFTKKSRDGSTNMSGNGGSAAAAGTPNLRPLPRR